MITWQMPLAEAVALFEAWGCGRGWSSPALLKKSVWSPARFDTTLSREFEFILFEQVEQVKSSGPLVEGLQL